jgi:hypothetical protein
MRRLCLGPYVRGTQSAKDRDWHIFKYVHAVLILFGQILSFFGPSFSSPWPFINNLPLPNTSSQRTENESTTNYLQNQEKTILASSRPTQSLHHAGQVDFVASTTQGQPATRTSCSRASSIILFCATSILATDIRAATVAFHTASAVLWMTCSRISMLWKALMVIQRPVSSLDSGFRRRKRLKISSRPRSRMPMSFSSFWQKNCTSETATAKSHRVEVSIHAAVLSIKHSTAKCKPLQHARIVVARHMRSNRSWTSA